VSALLEMLNALFYVFQVAICDMSMLFVFLSVMLRVISRCEDFILSRSNERWFEGFSLKKVFNYSDVDN
jgi:hypothetical protein